MLNKHELAAYLVNLHTLMQAQSSGPSGVSSTFLAEEYETYWGLLKESITNPETEEELNDV